MGDMKTPDFDDLLAAFDIPDATGLDAKESHEETEGQLKHTGMCLDDGLLAHHAATTADIPVVSVIVKNTSRQESLEGFGDGTHSVPVPPLQNGYRGLETSVDSSELPSSGFSKSFASTLNGDTSGELLAKAPIQHKPEATPLFSQSFSQFSPISSPESEDTQSSRVDSCQKQERPYFPDPSVLVETTLSDEQKTTSLSMFDGCPEESDTRENTLSNIADSTKTEHTLTEEPSGSYNGDKNVSHDGVLPPPNDPKQTQTDCDTAATSDMPAAHSYVKRQTSSCLEALVALNTGKDHSEQTNLKESSVVHCDSIKASPKVPTSPRSPRSPLEATKQLAKVSDSPVSIYSDCSGKASPHAMASGSPPAIPRVRIKTIKTTSGHIKRTVTSVVPDSEADEDQSAYESSPSQSMISEDSFGNMSPCQSQNVASDITVGMPVKGAPVSTLPSNVLHDKSEGHPKKPSLKQSPSIFHSASGPVEQGQKPKRIPPAPTGHATNTNFLPKAMHLANLNLVPHSVAASVATRSAGHQQSQHALASSTVCSTVPLVHQVKTPSPHPSTALPNTAAGTLNRLLNNANPVPTYVPNLNPPPESNISLPPRGYCCLECGDSFGVERSLMHHYGRRSVHIEVACTHCAKTLVFFNKCALLAHAREHKMKGTVMQCTQLFMKPIAEEQMFVPLSTGSLANADVRVLPSPSPKSQPVMPLYPDNVIRHRLRCLECNKQLSDYRALAGHYQRLSEDLEGLICKVCSMLSPNKCSFKAHQRLHAHKSPYCCPECGALSRSADIQKHVKENCLHYTRKAWYKCLHCDVVFKTVHGQKNHIEEKHCDVFYKCSICPVAFKSSDSCDTHIQNKHDTSSKTSPQLIFKCSCETVFKKKQLLFQHFHQSASKRATCVFKCPECSSVFPQKQVLMQHFKSVHGGIFKGEAEKNGNNQTDGTTRNQETVSAAVRQPGIPSSTATKRTDTSRKRAEDSKPHVKPAGWTCGECLQTFPERDPYVSHMKSDHGRSMKRYPCRQCERSFNSSTSLRRHIRNDHDIEQKTYSCWYCTDTKSVFNTGVMLKNHISLMHGIKNPDLSLMPKTPIPESNVSREGRGTKRPARPTDTQSERQDPAVSQGSAPSAKRPKASLFRCSKCGFATEHSTQFREHIPQHKTDENTPQCLHCGLCFTSPTSLNRHLYIVHKVKESEEDARQPLSSVEEPGIGGEVQHTPSSSSSSSEADAVNASLQRCSGDAYQAEEKSSVAHCDRGTLDCHLKPSSKAQTQEVCLQ